MYSKVGTSIFQKFIFAKKCNFDFELPLALNEATLTCLTSWRINYGQFWADLSRFDQCITYREPTVIFWKLAIVRYTRPLLGTHTIAFKVNWSNLFLIRQMCLNRNKSWIFFKLSVQVPIGEFQLIPKCFSSKLKGFQNISLFLIRDLALNRNNLFFVEMTWNFLCVSMIIMPNSYKH